MTDIKQADIDAMESILWVDTIIDDQEAIGKAFARHRQYGYDQGYYDGQRDRPPTQSDALLDAEDVNLYWYRQGKDDGVEHERAKIVAWLRKEAIMSTDTVRRRMNKALDQIEAGEHLK